MVNINPSRPISHLKHNKKDYKYLLIQFNQVNISALQDKTLKGYIEFLGPLHSQVSETLKLQKFAFDKYGKYIAADFHTEFRSKGEFETDQFAGQWGPMYADKGPLVRMLVWLHLSPEGYVIQLDSEAILIETAPSRPSA